MKIILSPAKKMIVDTDNLVPVELPVYIDKTAEVLNWIKSKSKEELKAIWKCNDKIAEQNFNRLENMDLYNRLTPAVLAYEGIAFQYMAPSVFEDSQFEYVQNHLRILSAVLWRSKTVGWRDTLPLGNAGKSRHRRCKKLI